LENSQYQNKKPARLTRAFRQTLRGDFSLALRRILVQRGFTASRRIVLQRNFVSLDLAVQRGEFHAENLRGLRLVPAAAAQRAIDQFDLKSLNFIVQANAM